MYAFGILILFTMIMSYIMIPEALNETASDAEVAELETKALGLAPKDKNPKANIGWEL